MIRVAIVADTRLYREGLAQGRDAGLCVVATAARGDEALAALPDLQADVILVDMAMPESRGVVRVILERAPLSRVIALGVVEDERSEEHTSELQSQSNLVCRLLLEKKKKKQISV